MSHSAPSLADPDRAVLNRRAVGAAPGPSTLIYRTAWVDAQGTLQDDLIGYRAGAAFQ